MKTYVCIKDKSLPKILNEYLQHQVTEEKASLEKVLELQNIVYANDLSKIAFEVGVLTALYAVENGYIQQAIPTDTVNEVSKTETLLTDQSEPIMSEKKK
jgi:hypothetical protein